jgi:hypothetical protein
MDWRIVPAWKPVLGLQSEPFQLQNHQGLGQSLLDADFVQGFANGFSEQHGQKQT